MEVSKTEYLTTVETLEVNLCTLNSTKTVRGRNGIAVTFIRMILPTLIRNCPYSAGPYQAKNIIVPRKILFFCQKGVVVIRVRIVEDKKTVLSVHARIESFDEA